jgi:hypothetical protein
MFLNRKSSNIIIPEYNFVTFKSDTPMIITPKFVNTGTLEYSTNKTAWNTITSGVNTISANIIYFRGIFDTNSLFANFNATNPMNPWKFNNGVNVKIIGNLNTLLNYNEPPTTLNSYAFSQMFLNCTNITDISELELPAMTLVGVSTHRSMFQNCTSITSIPSDLLPAMTLSNDCYENMFQNCTSITSIPSDLLPAMTLKNSCYKEMFQGCTSITSIPSDLLPAMTLGVWCYGSMFKGCTGITSIPDGFLPATTLTDTCYSQMFDNCTGITFIPSNLLPALIIKDSSYFHMFSGCSNLKINTTSTAGYTRPFRIPIDGTGTNATLALTEMFTGTIGTMKTTPSINTTYYTKD